MTTGAHEAAEDGHEVDVRRLARRAVEALGGYEREGRRRGRERDADREAPRDCALLLARQTLALAGRLAWRAACKATGAVASCPRPRLTSVSAANGDYVNSHIASHNAAQKRPMP